MRPAVGRRSIAQKNADPRSRRRLSYPLLLRIAFPLRLAAGRRAIYKKRRIPRNRFQVATKTSGTHRFYRTRPMDEGLPIDRKQLRASSSIMTLLPSRSNKLQALDRFTVDIGPFALDIDRSAFDRLLTNDFNQMSDDSFLHLRDSQAVNSGLQRLPIFWRLDSCEK